MTGRGAAPPPAGRETVAAGPPGGASVRWWRFVGERFPLPAHLLMTAAFLTGNATAAGVLLGAELPSWRLAPTAAMVVLFFFRLRLFDEIKDWRTDRSIHPDRPLARGLVRVAEARRMALYVGALELLLVLPLGRPALATWAAAALFSLLMYREFFAGAWLRPRMELYALSHTLIASWLGLAVAAALADRLAGPPAGIWLFALANWMIFNVFEFARKSYGREEERREVESYSGRLGPRGAGLLTLAMAVAAGLAAAVALDPARLAPAGRWALGGLGLLTSAATALYALRPGRREARLFRAAMSLFIVTLYPLLAAAVLLGSVR